jgi:hypothetical protein
VSDEKFRRVFTKEGKKERERIFTKVFRKKIFYFRPIYPPGGPDELMKK